MWANQVECTVNVDGEPLKEYKAKSKYPTVTTCYIAAKEGKEFSFQYDLSQYPAGKYNIKIWTDGIKQRDKGFYDLVGNFFEAKEWDDDAETVKFRKFKFCKFRPTDDTPEQEIRITDKKILDNLGTLAVQFAMLVKESFPTLEQDHLCDWPLESEGDVRDVVDESVYEKDVKDRPLTHRVELSEVERTVPVPAPTEHAETELPLGGPVIATFVFKYLSRAMLVALDIIEIDEDVEEMSQEEMQEEIKKLRASKRKREMEEIDSIPIKREHGGKKQHLVTSLAGKSVDLTKD